MNTNRAHLLNFRDRPGVGAFCSAPLVADVDPVPERFPAPPSRPWPCRVCRADLWVTIAGWLPNPTGDRPATESPLSDRLPALERALKRRR